MADDVATWAWLAEAVAGAGAGGARSVAVEAAPGAVAGGIESGAGGARVLVLRAVVGDQDVTYGVVDQLFAALGSAGAGASAAPGRIADSFEVGCRLFDVLAAATAEGPVVVAVDRVDDADVASLQALAIAARLAAAEPLVVVLSGSTGSSTRLPAGLPELVGEGPPVVLDLLGPAVTAPTSVVQPDPEFAALRARLDAFEGKYDDALAKDARELAERLLRRGAYAEVVSLFEAASSLTMLPFARQQLRLRAASIALTGGDLERADALIDDDLTVSDSALGCLVLGRRAFLHFDLDGAERWYLKAWEQVDQKLDKTVARLVASGLAEIQSAWLRPAAGWARRAVELFGDDALVRGNDPVSQLLIALGYEGRLRETADFETGKSHLFTEIEPGVTVGQSGRGHARLWRDELPAARADLEVALAAQRVLGPPTTWVTTAVSLADVLMRSGSWDDILVLGDLLANAGRGLANGDAIGLGEMCSAWVLAARGDFDNARRLLAPRADAVTSSYMATTAVGRARLSHAAGDDEAVIAQLAPFNSFKEMGLDNPALFAWRDWLADAYLSTGRLAEAESEITALAERSKVIDQRSVDATVQRLTGRLAAARGDAAVAARAFDTASAVARSLPMPFLNAAIAADQGAFLASAGRAEPAKRVLEAALAGFMSLDARPYAERVAAVLATVGGTAELPAPDPVRTLRPEQQAVAVLLRGGLGRDEIARRLLVSKRETSVRVDAVRAVAPAISG